MPQPNKQPKETEKDQIDKLIAFYDQNRPTAGQTILVNVPRKKLIKFVDGKIDDDHFRYRGRVLHCVYPAAQE